MARKHSKRNERVGLADGAPMWLPVSGDTPPNTNPAGTGKLATSGRDDTLRGDTVSRDTGHGLGWSGRESGAPTPGNRFPDASAEEISEADRDDD
jgi:hypothetical protein